ncbi:MAG: TlpA family protein disulfide reductase [Lachnospiraceae bacterium]
MNKYIKPVIGVAALAALLAGSSILYKNLSSEYKPENVKPVGEKVRQTNCDTSVIEDETDLPESSSTAATATDSDASEGTATPHSAPDFTVYTAAGDEVHLSDFLGQPVILNFWASWCGPCKREMPLFQQMYDAYGADIAFVVVNLTDGYSETVETAQGYIGEQGYTFPVYFDTEQDAAYAYYVTSIPTTYFIDAQGNIVAYGQGSLSEESFEQGLSMLGF